MIKRLLTDHGYYILATNYELDAISKAHKEGTSDQVNPMVLTEMARIHADRTPAEEAYRIGRNSVVGAIGAVALVSAVAAAGVWAEKTGRIDIFPDKSRVDISIQQGPNTPAEVASQMSPADIPPIVRIDQ